MSEAKDVMKNIGKGLANKGRNVLDSGKQKAVETGRIGLEKAREAGHDAVERTRREIEARRGQQANETLNAIDDVRDKTTALATNPTGVLAPGPIQDEFAQTVTHGVDTGSIQTAGDMERVHREYTALQQQAESSGNTEEFLRNRQDYQQDASIRALEERITRAVNLDPAVQKAASERDPRWGEIWDKEQSRISRREWDRYVTENPDQAKKYAPHNAEIKAALDRQEKKRADSLPPVTGASDDDIDKLPEDVFADRENSTQDALPEPAPITEGVTDDILDALNQEHPDVGASLTALAHDPAAEAAVRDFLADPTDEHAEAVIDAALAAAPLDPAPETGTEDLPIDSAPIAEDAAGDGGGSGAGETPPPGDTDHDDHGEDEGDSHGTGADHGAHDEHGHHGSKINWKKIGIYASNALLMPAVPIINPKTVGWSERGIHRIQEYLETHPDAAKRIRRLRTAALVALVIYIGGLNLAGKALK